MRQAGVKFSTDASSASDSETEIEPDGTRGRRRRKKKKSEMRQLLQDQQELLKKVVSALEIDSPEIATLSNALSKNAVTTALKNERFRQRYDYSNTLGDRPEPPTTSEQGCTPKEHHEAVQNLKNVIRNPVTGEEFEGIGELLRHVTRLGNTNRMTVDQVYDLIKSRLRESSIILRTVINSHRQQVPLKQLYRDLTVTYSGGASLITTINRLDKFNGEGMTASSFIGTLKNLAAEVVLSSKETENYQDSVYEKTKERTLILLPSIAHMLLERHRLILGPGRHRGTISSWTETVMSCKDAVEQVLNKKKIKSINVGEDEMPEATAFMIPTRINKVNENQMETRRTTPSTQETQFVNSLTPTSLTTKQASNDANPQQAPDKICVLKLSKEILNNLRDKCYKCGSRSPIQEEDHYSGQCLLYQGEALAMYLCSLCETGVHLPSNCKQHPSKMEALRDKAKSLNIEITHLDGKICIITKN